MIINMVGNTNGSYKIPRIDLFELAKQKETAPEKITTVADLLGDIL